MLFHTINKPVPKQIVSIKTNVIYIERVDNFKYLGIYLDEILHWNKRVEYVCNSLIKFFGIFNHIKCKVNLKLSRQLYYAFIYSKIKYGMEVYGSCSSTNIGKIQTMQKKTDEIGTATSSNDTYKRVAYAFEHIESIWHL